jgi:uncharacterized membrane protein
MLDTAMLQFEEKCKSSEPERIVDEMYDALLIPCVHLFVMNLNPPELSRHDEMKGFLFADLQ